MHVDRVKELLFSLAASEHMGDVNNTIPALCQALGLETPEWSDEKERWVFPWDEEDDE